MAQDVEGLGAVRSGLCARVAVQHRVDYFVEGVGMKDMTERQLIEDLLSALEYHTEQTRPIQFSNVAMEAAREYLRKPAQQECRCNQGQVCHVCDPITKGST